MNEDSKYKVLIVDDEFLARKLLSDYVAKIPQLSLIDACSNAIEALTRLQQQQIDILLLDIHMPDISGLELVKNLRYPPAIIFTTAYSHYAIESYDLGATDYLLKPIGFPRFFQAINKVLDKLCTVQPLPMPSEEQHTIQPIQDFLVVKADYKIYKINFCDLIYVEGQLEYVTFHTSSRKITAYYTLKALEEQLPSDQFLRIHKSFIVSFHHIEALEGNMVTVAGSKLPIGGSYREALMLRFNPK